MNWKLIERQGREAVKRERLASRARTDAETYRSSCDLLENEYARGLHCRLKRLAQAVVEKHSSCWHVLVQMRPLIDHNNHTAKPFATICWAGKGGRFEFEALLTNDAEVGEFLTRFEATIKINGGKNKSGLAATRQPDGKSCAAVSAAGDITPRSV